MTVNEFFGKVMCGKFWANIAAMLLVVVLLCLGVKFGIDIYTHHGEEIKVPDIKHKQASDAKQLLANRGLEMQVVDTGYVKTLPSDCVLDQMLAPGTMVKRGRIVYVVVNSAHSPMLTLPEIIDNSSYREARANLMAMGFRVGPPQYVSGEKDWVYGVVCDGQNLRNGQKVSVEKVLTIQVGDGVMDFGEDVTYTDPEYAQKDSTENSEHESGVIEGSGGNDDFEVVNGPE